MAEILFLAHRIPYPPTKGEKIRAYHLLSHLARAHVVHLGCFVDDPSDWRHAEHLRALCGECHFAALSRARAWRGALAAVARNEALSVAILRDAALARWIGDLVQRRPVDCVFAYSSATAQFLTGARAAPAAYRRFRRCGLREMAPDGDLCLLAAVLGIPTRKPAARRLRSRCGGPVR